MIYDSNVLESKSAFLRYLCLFFCLLTSCVIGAVETFTATTVEGVEMTFRITDENEKFVEVYASGSTAAINTATIGPVTIPSTVVYSDITYNVNAIGEFAFYKCKLMTSITIPKSVKSIGANAFYYCENLNSIYMWVQAVYDIDDLVFSYDTYSDATLYVPLGTKYSHESILGYSDAEGWKRFKNIESTTEVGALEFSVFFANKYYGLYYRATSEGEENTCEVYSSDRYMICNQRISYEIPAEIKGFTVTSIADDAALTVAIGPRKAIIMPNTIVNIGRYGFSGYGGSYIIFPESVRNIGELAFYSSHLSTIDTGDGVTTIGNNAFSFSDYVSNIHIGKNVVSIGDKAFSNIAHMSPIDPIEIPDNVQTIGSECFKNSFNIVEVKLGNGLTTLPDGVFSECSNLRSVSGGDNIKVIGRSAFKECQALSSYTVPSSVTTIREGAFGSCTSLEKIELPIGLTTIGNSLFYNCQSLKSVTFPSTLSDVVFSVDGIYQPGRWIGMFSACKSLRYVDFRECTHLNTPLNIKDLRSNMPESTIIYLPQGTYMADNNLVVTDENGNASCENITISANVDVEFPVDINVHGSVSNSRAITTDNTQTLCLPYDYILPDGLVAYTLANEDTSGNLMFEKVESGIIEANKPYLVKASQNIDNLNASNVTIKSTESINAGIDGYEFVGTLSAISAAEAVSMGAYILSDNNEWLPMTEDSEGIKPGTAFLIPTSSSPNKIKSILFTPTVKNVIAIISYILGESPDDFDATAADLNGDGEVTITDASILMDMIGK